MNGASLLDERPGLLVKAMRDGVYIELCEQE
jgi:hypothetical protein